MTSLANTPIMVLCLSRGTQTMTDNRSLKTKHKFSNYQACPSCDCTCTGSIPIEQRKISILLDRRHDTPTRHHNDTTDQYQCKFMLRMIEKNPSYDQKSNKSPPGHG